MPGAKCCCTAWYLLAGHRPCGDGGVEVMVMVMIEVMMVKVMVVMMVMEMVKGR